ncbi:MAG: Fe-S cluster assembly ATPase SufC [Myxococcota bacterium]
MLTVNGLHVVADRAKILRGVDLTVRPGEVHAIMGRNGSGKSTLAKTLAGHPQYEVTAGSVDFDGHDLLELEADERARVGVFMAFQYPVELPGVSNTAFLRQALNAKLSAHGQEELDPLEFDDLVREKADLLEMDASFLDRSVNVDFSGGERKRNEILQMAILEPKLALLDETDSGLDIDALRIVAEGILKLKSEDTAVVLVTHHQRILNYIQPDRVHVMMDGRVVKSGSKELALQLEQRGYEWITEELAGEGVS